MARRRGQRTGYVYRRGDSWFGQFRIDTTDLDERGRFIRKTLTKYIAPAAGAGKVTLKRARVIFYEEHLKDLHKTGPLSTRTLAEFVAESFRPQVVLQCKPEGRKHYEYVLEYHVLPALGQYMMRDIGPQQVYNLIQAKLKARGKNTKRLLSVQTVTHIRNTLSSLFRHAKRMRAYSGDIPTEGVKLPALEHKERHALTWSQVQAIAAVIGYPDPARERKKHAPQVDTAKVLAKQAADNVQLGALVRVLALTGLRIGEAMGLCWRNVDLEAGVLQVRQNYVRGQYGTLKTAKSRRDVPLHSIAIAELRKVREAALTALRKADEKAVLSPDAPVWAGAKSGRPLDQHNIAADFLRPAAKRAGVACSWHVLRHTASTLGHEAGLTIEQRRKVLGHAADDMTMRYTHPDLEAVREGLEKIGKESVN